MEKTAKGNTIIFKGYNPNLVLTRNDKTLAYHISEITEEGQEEIKETFTSFPDANKKWVELFSPGNIYVEMIDHPVMGWEEMDAALEAASDDENPWRKLLKEAEDENPVKKIAEQAGVTTVTVYKIARQLGRLPTLEEIKNRKRGRPRKY